MTKHIHGAAVMPLRFDETEEIMATKSRYMAYAEGLRKDSEKKEERYAPKSILKKLKEKKVLIRSEKNGGK